MEGFLSQRALWFLVNSAELPFIKVASVNTLDEFVREDLFPHTFNNNVTRLQSANLAGKKWNLNVVLIYHEMDIFSLNLYFLL